MINEKTLRAAAIGTNISRKEITCFFKRPMDWLPRELDASICSFDGLESVKRGNYMRGMLKVNQRDVLDLLVKSSNAESANIRLSNIQSCADAPEPSYVNFLKDAISGRHLSDELYYTRLYDAVETLLIANEPKSLADYCHGNPKLRLRDTESEFLYRIWLMMKSGYRLDPITDQATVIIYTYLPTCDSCYWFLFSTYLSSIIPLPENRLEILIRSCAYDSNPKHYLNIGNMTKWRTLRDSGWRIILPPFERQNHIKISAAEPQVN
jgi:hypothetical protein